MHTALMVILPMLIVPLAALLIAAALRPRRADDLLRRAVGDVPRLVRGGYSAPPGPRPIAPTTGSGVRPAR